MIIIKRIFTETKAWDLYRNESMGFKGNGEFPLKDQKETVGFLYHK